MSREQPKNPPPPITKWSDEKQGRTIGGTQVVIQERRYRLITPLFGGGVEPGVNDPDNLIRATEIRGQLRFWWRAMRGGQFGGNLARMKEREDEIWGAASKTKKQSGEAAEEQGEDAKKPWKEAVQVMVEVQNKGKIKKPFKPAWNENRTKIQAPPDVDIPAYAAFPLRPSKDKLKAAERAGGPEHVTVEDVREGVTFLLHISFPHQWRQEVEAALWAWETFGGVGARTRRGFGALQRDDIEEADLPPEKPYAAKEWMKRKILQYSEKQEKGPADVPHIHTGIDMQILGPLPRPAAIWKRLIDRLQQFRQQRVDAHSGRPSLYGKSLWPEANALRNRLHPNKQRNATLDKFPRAAFGLPIVFHLAHESPSKTIILQGIKEGSERWASRLILKPLPCQNRQFLGLAMVLDGSALPEDDLALMHDGKQWKTIAKQQTEVKAGELQEIIGNETDVLRAFLNFLMKKENRQ